MRVLSPYFTFPIRCHPKNAAYIHLRLTTAFMNRTSELSLRIFKQTNAVSIIGERWAENYLHCIFLCSEV